MTDAARFLPFLGVFLFLLPILWRPAETPAPDTARGGIYLFIVWFALIAAAFVLARVLQRDDGEGAADAEGNPAGDDEGTG